MSCCFCCSEPDEDDHAKGIGNPGPEVERRCTDVFCMIMHVAMVWGLVGLFTLLRDAGSTLALDHGHDHYGNICGVDKPNEPYTYYPDLKTDFTKDSSMQRKKWYGICVEKCPERETTIQDYNGTGGEPIRGDGMWFVGLPVFPLAGRCIPYDPGPNYSNTVEFCASPPCLSIANNETPTSARQVCGIDRDGTNRYWLLSRPDDTLLEAWRAMGIAEEIITKRLQFVSQEKDGGQATLGDCELAVVRDMRLALKQEDDPILLKVLTKYTGIAFRWGTAVYRQRYAVLFLGIGGTLFCSFWVVSFFACCVRIVLLTLTASLFLVLSVANYLLFVQAGLATGGSGRIITGIFEEYVGFQTPAAVDDLLTRSGEYEHTQNIYKWCGVILSVVIALLACAVLALRKNFNMLVALFQEAGHVIRQMPSLLFFPMILVTSMVIASLYIMRVFLALATMDATDSERFMQIFNDEVYMPMEPLFSFLRMDGDAAFDMSKNCFVWILIFTFLWVYFFHVALFQGVTAMTVSHWYFYRDDPEYSAGTGYHTDGWFPGRPVIFAAYRICRYHLGSLAFGSMIVALATMPRILLEYINKQTEAHQNSVTRMIMWATRCCLWCVQKCIQWLTEYAYVYVAVTGKPFCTSARRSCELFMQYPVQVSLDKMVSTALGYLACITLPAGMAVLSYFAIKSEWAVCAFFIAALAYIITRLAVGVYDITVTTLFICAMRDSKHFNGRYMPPTFAAVAGFQCEGERSSKANRLTQLHDKWISGNDAYGRSPRNSGRPPSWGVEMEEKPQADVAAGRPH